ncbi:MAG: NAD-dependent epimerase/dehydratase family protein [Gemmataceae bacterium]|nr:NAD-dependent epimerase/dehydratase family protein [Gemmataceae bacterium]
MTEELLCRGYTVVGYDWLKCGAVHLLGFFEHGERYVLFRGDVRDRERLRTALSGVDAVVHLAAVVGFPACAAKPELAREVNVEAVRVLNSVRGATQPVIFSSTGSVYGALPGICSEESALNPETVYGQTKAEAERILLDAGNVVVFRLATGFGLSRRLRLDLLPNQWAYRAAHGEPLTVFEAEFKRTFLHVRDIARALALALENFSAMRDQIYNCGDESLNMSKLELARAIRELAGCEIQEAPGGKDQDRRNYWVSYDKISRFGFRAQVSLREGLCQMIRAFRHLDEPARYQAAA